MTVGGLMKELEGIPPQTEVFVAVGQVNNVAWRPIFTVANPKVVGKAKSAVVIVGNRTAVPSKVG